MRAVTDYRPNDSFDYFWKWNNICVATVLGNDYLHTNERWYPAVLLPMLREYSLPSGCTIGPGVSKDPVCRKLNARRACCVLCNVNKHAIDETGFSKYDKLFASISGVLDQHKLVCGDDPDYIELDPSPCVSQPFSWNEVYDSLECTTPFTAQLSFKFTAPRYVFFYILRIMVEQYLADSEVPPPVYVMDKSSPTEHGFFTVVEVIYISLKDALIAYKHLNSKEFGKYVSKHYEGATVSSARIEINAEPYSE